MISPQLSREEHCISMSEVALVYLKNWEYGKKKLSRILPCAESDVAIAEWGDLQDAYERWQNDKGKYHFNTWDARYFRFLYPYLVNKTPFYWKNAYKIESAEEIHRLGEDLHHVLTLVEKNGYSFGDWWNQLEGVRTKMAQSETKEQRAIVMWAELLGNRILSEYFRYQQDASPRLLSQIRVVEDLVCLQKEKYSAEEMVEMYKLARILGNITFFQVDQSKIFVDYKSFEDFLRTKAQAGDFAEILQVRNKITNEQGNKPDFDAFVAMHNDK